MITNYVVYEEKTGRICKAVTCPASTIQLQCADGETFLEGTVNSDDFHVVSGKIVRRPPSIVSLVDRTLFNVSKGARITIDGESYIADGSPVEISFGLPGKYKVTVSDWPYLDWEAYIEN